MNKENLNKLVDEAGFVRFSVEEDPDMPIDWSSDYSVELEKFAELLVQRTLAIVEAHTEIFQSSEARAMVEHIKQSVKTDFGVEG